jgi:hypothetical protein
MLLYNISYFDFCANCSCHANYLNNVIKTQAYIEKQVPIEFQCI